MSNKRVTPKEARHNGTADDFMDALRGSLLAAGRRDMALADYNESWASEVERISEAAALLDNLEAEYTATLPRLRASIRAVLK